MTLTKQQILEASDTKTQEVEVPEWVGSVTIQTMTGYARDQFEGSITGKNGAVNTTNIRAKLVAACVVDDAGELMFGEKDIAKLGKKSAAALERVFSAAQSMNRISDNDVEELAKN
jgi:ABC-type uncharacterized transport system ATPase component